MELASPGVQYLANASGEGNYQLYNVIITAHALLMIFFMVNFIKYIYFDLYTMIQGYIKHLAISLPTEVNNAIWQSYIYNPKPGASKRMKPGYINQCLEGKEVPYGLRKVVIHDPFHNRHIMQEHAKGHPGCYVFQDKVTGATYVGGAESNLYSRSCSYFFPSIVKTEERRVLRYFLKYGYNNLMLTYFVLPVTATVSQVLEVEQFLIDTLKPDLNVDLIAGGMSGYHEPMSEALRLKLRQERGTSFFVYDLVTNSLIFSFDSIQYAVDQLNIHRATINSLLDGEGTVSYMDRFIFCVDPMGTFKYDFSLSVKSLKRLFTEVRSTWTPIQPASRGLLAENVLHPQLSTTYSGISEFSRAIKGDRATIRQYLNGTKPAGSLYRNQWKLTQL